MNGLWTDGRWVTRTITSHCEPSAYMSYNTKFQEAKRTEEIHGGSTPVIVVLVVSMVF